VLNAQLTRGTVLQLYCTSFIYAAHHFLLSAVYDLAINWLS